MRKRLRKKRRLGEFCELGFNLFVKHVSDVDLDESWLFEFFERLDDLGLDCGGGSTRRVTRLYVSRHRRSVSEDDRRAVSEWLATRREVASHAVGRLVDSWHVTEDAYETETAELETAATPGGVMLDSDAARERVGRKQRG